MKHKVKKHFTQGYSFTDSANSNFYWLLSVTAFCLFPPVCIFYYFHGSYLVYANESLAYRYFTTYRLISEESGSIWLPQGFDRICISLFINMHKK